MDIRLHRAWPAGTVANVLQSSADAPAATVVAPPAAPRRGPLRALRLLAFGSLLGLLLVLAALAVAVTASGVFDRRAGSWAVPLHLAGGITVDANVAGLARLATSPLGLRLLDGRSSTTRAGHLRFARDGDTLILRCAPCRLRDPRIAAHTVALPPVELRITRHAGAENNNKLDLRLAADDLRINATATLSPDGIELDWQLPSTVLAEVYRVVADAAPEARYARIDGRIAASGSVRLPAARSESRVTLDGAEVGGLNTERLQSGWFTFGCAAADGSARRVVSGDGEKGWLDSEALGRWLPAAVLAAEDQRFMQHAGYDDVQIAAVLGALDLGDDAAPGARRGASTLTQQLARTLFTGGERTASRKLRELLYALEIERTLGKERILLLYLNTVDWGPGLCGARAAARVYFGKRVAQLTPLEAAWLAGILRSPHAAHAQQFVGGKPDPKRAQWVLAQMQQMQALPKAERERWAQRALVLAEPKAAARSGPPALAQR